MKQQNEHDFSHKKFRDTIRIEEKNAEKYFSLKQILIAKYAELPFLTTSLRTFFLCDKKISEHHSLLLVIGTYRKFVS